MTLRDKIREERAQALFLQQGWARALTAAHEAGAAAAKACRPTPLGPVRDVITGKIYPASETGPVCGFAWILFLPERGGITRKLANYLTGKSATRVGCEAPTVGRWEKAYGGGISYWISLDTQSVDIKRAYGSAFVDTLRAELGEGFRFYVESRLD